MKGILIERKMFSSNLLKNQQTNNNSGIKPDRPTVDCKVWYARFFCRKLPFTPIPSTLLYYISMLSGLGNNIKTEIQISTTRYNQVLRGRPTKARNLFNLFSFSLSTLRRAGVSTEGNLWRGWGATAGNSSHIIFFSWSTFLRLFKRFSHKSEQPLKII